MDEKFERQESSELWQEISGSRSGWKGNLVSGPEGCINPDSRTNIARFYWHGNPILSGFIMSKALYEMLKPLPGKGFKRFFK
jgi:hypothetical protein